MSDEAHNKKSGPSEILSLLRLMGEKVDPAILDILLRQSNTFLRNVAAPPQTPIADDRWQYKAMAEEIPDKASILDLGCGEGDLLAWLSEKKHAKVQGVELNADQVTECVGKSIPVIQADLDSGLEMFPDKCFDYVILEETVQTLRRPDQIISEMRRVGRRCIVSFPNFAYWRVRLDLALCGRMPMTSWLPHQWYKTPNIHLFSIQDFIDYAENTGMKIIRIQVVENGIGRAYRSGDNLYAEEAMVFFE